MPGIGLAYRKKSKELSIKNICDAVSSRMYNSNEFQSVKNAGDNSFWLKVICRKRDYFGISESSHGFVSWLGRPLYKNNFLNDKSFEPLKRIIDSKGIDLLLANITGHFQLVIYLKDSKKCYVVCDKASTHPFYYIETDDFVSFSPEPLTFKALKEYNYRLSVRREAIFEYMSSGYLWGDRCFFNEVKRLGPGQFACIGREGIKIKSYWRMSFSPKKASKKNLLSELSSAIQKDIDYLPNGKKALTLSGGYDSRALLGLLKNSNGQLNTISYGFGSENNKNMDIDVGGYYANKARVSHRYYQPDIGNSSRLIKDIKNVIFATGGENYLSVFQDAFLGVDFYKYLANNYDYMIRGDEVWGWGDLAVTADMAFWEARMFNLNEILHPKKIMKAESFDFGVEYIRQLRYEFSKEYKTTSANDLKDYLYWRHREARLLQSMAYFRRCYISHFAPFLLDRTLDVIKRIRTKYRVNKNLFICMCEEMFPALFLDKKAVSPHVSDVNNFFSLCKDEKFLSFIKGSLLESKSKLFNSVFDKAKLEKWIDEILNGGRKDITQIRRKHDLKQMAMIFIAKSAYVKGWVKAFMVKKEINIFPVLGINYLFRLVILSLVLQEYDEA